MNTERTSIQVARQRGEVMAALDCGRWRTTKGIANACPFGLRTARYRLDELEGMGAIVSRRLRSLAGEVQWKRGQQ